MPNLTLPLPAVRRRSPITLAALVAAVVLAACNGAASPSPVGSAIELPLAASEMEAAMEPVSSPPESKSQTAAAPAVSRIAQPTKMHGFPYRVRLAVSVLMGMAMVGRDRRAS